MCYKIVYKIFVKYVKKKEKNKNLKNLQNKKKHQKNNNSSKTDTKLSCKRRMGVFKIIILRITSDHYCRI